ncbi:hypothetical protein [Methylotuvimicrobium alcaliphilum]|uniref:hypothetical protein n=1 Tax=Methylotuvimicrobium alcaliphilum TaxID=271065 RepID=UPI0005FB072E|nr:hypothetical protein [Methylotuvimicrobium alcaliphilum]
MGRDAEGAENLLAAEEFAAETNRIVFAMDGFQSVGLPRNDDCVAFVAHKPVDAGLYRCIRIGYVTPHSVLRRWM